MDLTVDGRTVFTFTNGRDFQAEKPTILFVHGAGMDHSVWTLQARYFAHHGFNAVAIDLPGHGRSEGPPLPSIEAMADWLAALTETLVTEPAALVGHSMGALICLETASRHQGSVKQLALLGVAPTMPVHPALLEAAEADQPLAAELVSSWGHGSTGHVGGNQAPGGWLMGHAQKLLAKAGEIPVAFEAIHSRSTLFAAFLASCLTWLCIFATCYLVLLYFEVVDPAEITFGLSIVGTTALNVTCVLPINGLGNLGTWEAGWAAGYMLLGMDKATAFQTGFGLHIAIYGFALLLGALGWLGTWRRR